MSEERINVAGLRRLMHASTGAPWALTWQISDDWGSYEWPKHLGRRLPPHWDYYLDSDDAELIVAMRNALPALLNAVEAANENVYFDGPCTRAPMGRITAALAKFDFEAKP